MNKLQYAAILAVALVPSLCGCGKQEKVTPDDTGKPENAVYHWKNYMSLSNYEVDFLNDHHIDRLYVRLFDVRADYRYGAVPDASAYLSLSKVPEGTKIVPTVFITLEALREMEGKENELALNIYQRVGDMLKAKERGFFDELQIDCDWTESTRESFFKLCEALGAQAHKRHKQLSATIRLHQLSQPTPPVDKGVLMVYNIGELKDPNETNSILRADIVKEYLDKAPRYPLKLDVAYPAFSWGVAFNGNEFDRLVRMTSHPDSVSSLRLLHDNIYELSNPRLNENILTADYHQTLRYEQVSPETLRQVKKLVEKYLGGRPERIILYHLDEASLRNYTPDEISAIYE